MEFFDKLAPPLLVSHYLLLKSFPGSGTVLVGNCNYLVNSPENTMFF